MPRMPTHAASGTGKFIEDAAKVIRFARYGCTNRTFYHIVVMHKYEEQKNPPIEQLGTFDPIPNFNNEKLVSFNYERIQYWIGMGAKISKPVAELLGFAGFLPIHPVSYMKTWRIRDKARQKQLEEEKAKGTSEASSAQ